MTGTLNTILPYIQVILSVLLVGAVLLQRSEAGLGAGFGGDGFSSGHHERRGSEKTLFYGTIVIAVLFVISAFLTFTLK